MTSSSFHVNTTSIDFENIFFINRARIATEEYLKTGVDTRGGDLRASCLPVAFKSLSSDCVGAVEQYIHIDDVMKQ